MSLKAVKLNPGVNEYLPSAKDSGLRLTLNDGSILTHIARYKPKTLRQRQNLLTMLSPDGKRVAEILLGRNRPASGTALKTADGLRKWARELPKSRTGVAKVRWQTKSAARPKSATKDRAQS
jgi:hypothetical protein